MTAKNATTALPPTDPIGLAALLRGAEAAISDPETAGQVIRTVLERRPHDVEARLAAYRFSFFRHDYASAQEHAGWLIAHAARQLNIATDWKVITPDDAPFTEHAFAPGLYLQALIAAGYCAARLGRWVAAEELLTQAARLDPTDRFGGAHLLAILRAHATEQDD